MYTTCSPHILQKLELSDKDLPVQQPIRRKVPKQDVECATKKSTLQTLLVADVARYSVQNIDIQNYMDAHLITEQKVENNLRKQTQWSFCPNCLKYNDTQIMLL